MKYIVQDYFTGLDIVNKNGYTKYFKTLDDADNFIELLTKDGYNDEDNFYTIQIDENGNKITIEY